MQNIDQVYAGTTVMTQKQKSPLAQGKEAFSQANRWPVRT